MLERERERDIERAKLRKRNKERVKEIDLKREG